MTYNLSRACLCGHRHHPGSCPVRICGCTVLRPDPEAAAEDERDPTWDEALAGLEAAGPATVTQPHAFAEAIQADLDICWCGKGAGHLIHRAATAEKDCRQPCDADCEIGPVHCWNRHRPNHKPDWHDGAACDAATREAG